MQGEDAAGGATPQAAGEDARVDSAAGPELHHEFDREIAPVLAELIAAALESGALLVGGRFELRGGVLVREVGR